MCDCNTPISIVWQRGHNSRSLAWNWLRTRRSASWHRSHCEEGSCQSLACFRGHRARRTRSACLCVHFVYYVDSQMRPFGHAMEPNRRGRKNGRGEAQYDRNWAHRFTCGCVTSSPSFASAFRTAEYIQQWCNRHFAPVPDQSQWKCDGHQQEYHGDKDLQRPREFAT